ncbi:MAG: ECF transporter S component, partial [Anaerococcus sp.]
MNNKEKTRKLVVTAMLGAITIVLGLTPLGFIPLGFINITTMHIPVIIGAILEGPIVGAIVGLLFGLFSIVNAII